MINEQRYTNLRPVGGNYFILKKYNSKKCITYTLDELIKDLKLDDYYIFKYTSQQRLVTNEEFLSFKNAGYIFFKKSLYNSDHIELWLEWLKTNKLETKFLVKPLPPVEVLNKIQIKK